jgi:hypothetical protein
MNTQPQKFHWKWWFYAIQLLPILVMGGGFGVILYGMFGVLLHILKELSVAGLCLLVGLLSLLPPIGVWILIVVWKAGNLIVSGVTPSPQGLEVRNWPLYRVLLPWDQMPNSQTWQRMPGMLHLDNALDRPEGAFTLWLRKFFLRFTPKIGRSISLYGVQGYPKGKFADQLRRYAPQLFTEELK